MFYIFNVKFGGLPWLIFLLYAAVLKKILTRIASHRIHTHYWS